MGLLGFGMHIFWNWERLMLRCLSTHRNPRGSSYDLGSRCCQKQGGEGEEDGLGDRKSFWCKGKMNISGISDTLWCLG